MFLCGHSIFLGGLAGALESVPDVHVTRHPALSGSVDLTDFNAVVVDFDHVDAADVLAILRDHPDLKVIGVNVPGGAVTVLSGKVYLAHTLADVIQRLGEQNFMSKNDSVLEMGDS